MQAKLRNVRRSLQAGVGEDEGAAVGDGHGGDWAEPELIVKIALCSRTCGSHRASKSKTMGSDPASIFTSIVTFEGSGEPNAC
jgi:hypothetical protein